MSWLTILILIATVGGCGRVPFTAGSDARPVLRVAVVDGSVETQEAINEQIRKKMRPQDVLIETRSYPRILLSNMDETLEYLQSDQAPDILLLPVRWMAVLLHERGALLTLDHVFGRGFDRFGVLYGAARSSSTWRGEMIGVPITASPVMIVYNQERFQDAGIEPDPDWTWPGYLEVSQRVIARRQTE